MKITEPAVFGLDMYKLISKSKIILNIHGEIAGDYAGNVRLFEATGDIDESIKHWQRYIDLEADELKVSEAENHLQTLRR